MFDLKGNTQVATEEAKDYLSDNWELADISDLLTATNIDTYSSDTQSVTFAGLDNQEPELIETST